MGNSSTPITERKYLVPFVLVTSLFFLWALGVNLNDILIPHLKKAFNLTDTQSSFIQFVFFGGYFLAALPAGWLMERIGYRKSILTGLGTCAIGALLFIPAASIRTYSFFLFALFVLACGQGVLESAANPYVTILGPPESSERRLNLAQSFNAVGAVVTPFIGKMFILSGIEYSAATLAAMTPEQWQIYSASEAHRVTGTYLAIAGIFLFIAILFFFVRMPEVREATGEALAVPEAAPKHHGKIWHHKHLVRGVITEFFYIGAQVGITSFVIRFAQHALPGIPEKAAATFLLWHLIGFMIGRFTGSAIMKRIAPHTLLGIFSMAALICTLVAVFMVGALSVWAVVLLGFFDSIMFPTIFALSIKNLGVYTKLGSSLLVMAIFGGAVIPPIMGYISDHSSIQAAFGVPLFCYIIVIYFAFSGYKPTLAAAEE